MPSNLPPTVAAIVGVLDVYTQLAKLLWDLYQHCNHPCKDGQMFREHLCLCCLYNDQRYSQEIRLILAPILFPNERFLD